MIARTLIPEELSPPSPVALQTKPRRVSTALDSRTLIPQNLPVVPLTGGGAIPSHVPLDVLGERTLVPRDLPLNLFSQESVSPPYAPLSVLDERMVVPVGLPPTKLEILSTVSVEEFPDMLEPDVITAGNVNLLPRPVAEPPKEQSWVPRAGSVVFHVVVLVLLLFQSKLFPYRPPTQTELELARRQLSFVYLPPGALDVPKVTPPPERPSSQIRIDPRILRQVAPDLEPSPLPGPPQPETPRVQPELPNAPRPPAGTEQQGPNRPKEGLRIEPLQAPKPPSQLILPQMSPGRALEESAREALQDRGADTNRGFADPIPPSPGGGAGGGGGQGYLGGNLELLTPTEGVDFSNYLARLLASVKRNWYAVIPESARLGEKGRVVIQFHVLRSGDVPYPEPALVMTSGKEALDRAAMSAIRASSPFEPLPPAFSGPYIELRFIFLYNLPLDYQ